MDSKDQEATVGENQEPNPQATETSPGIVIPDGGLEAWCTIAGAWLVLFCTFGYSYTFGVYEDYYSRVYLTNHSPSSISWIGSFQLMMTFLLGPLAGKLLDDGGFRTLEVIGCTIFTFSVFMLSLAKPDQYYQIFLAQGVGMGIGLGLTFLPTLGIVVHHFKRRRGLASGIVLSGSSAGATIFPIMLNHLLPKIGFGPSIRATGYILPGCLILGICLMRTRLPPRPKNNVSGLGIKSWRGSFGFLLELQWSLAIVGVLLGVLGLYFPVIYIQLFSTQHDIDSTLTFYSLPILNATSAFGRILGNHLADLYGPFNIQILCTLSAGGVLWAVLGVHDGATLVVVSVLYGILSGLSLCFACFSSLARRPEEVGTRVGLALSICGIGTLISGPIQGALLTASFAWINAIAFSGAVMIAGALCLLGTRILRSRATGKWKV